MEKVEIKAVIKDLSSPLPERREEALAAILSRREEAVPELLAILQKLKDVPVGAAVTLSDWSWFLSAYLLAQFRERKAVPLLLAQFSMSPEHLERMFRDILREDLPRLLATFCAEDASPLRGLVGNKSIHESVRASALWGYTLLAAVGAVPVEEVKAFYRELMGRELGGGKLERVPSQVWTSLVAGCAALHAQDLRREILRAYEEELADAGAYSMKEVLGEWSLAPSESLKRLGEESGGLIRDIWEEIEFWPWVEGEDEEAVEE